MSRGRRLLQAQRRLGLAPLGLPPEGLTDDERCAWADIVNAAPDVLRVADRYFVRALAVELTEWRAGDHVLGVRDMYRHMGCAFIPMRERRRLLFPGRFAKS